MHFLTSIYKCKICFLPAPETPKGKGQGKSSTCRTTFVHSSPADEVNDSPDENEAESSEDVEVVDSDSPVASRYVYNLQFILKYELFCVRYLKTCF